MRGSSWRKKQEAMRGREIDMDFLAESVASGKFGQWGDNEIDRKTMDAWDNLSDIERLSVLERGKFTGMWQEDDLGSMNAYIATSKKDMVSTLQEELSNVADGFDMDDTNHYVVKIKGKSAFYSYDRTKPLTNSEINKIEWISANSGLSNYRYYAKDDNARAQMVKEMGFHEFKNGKEVNNHNGKYFADRFYSYEEQYWHD